MTFNAMHQPLKLFDIAGKVAVITGASGTYGQTCAVSLGALGARLMLVSGDVARLEDCAGQVRAAGGEGATLVRRPDSGVWLAPISGTRRTQCAWLRSCSPTPVQPRRWSAPWHCWSRAGCCRCMCDARTLDLVVREGFGARLAVLGPMEQADMIGLNLTLNIHRVLMPHLDNTPVPQPLLEHKVASGATGMAAGKGFSDWTPQEAEVVRERFRRFVTAQGKAALRR